ncbi:hypothetical protein Lepto7375DRAFT_6317 [Leptolyngbya sp. PCC 7375]|nr:hypothetical protein Lepto7375DRAFT_6317 [Leptolyngbya sp. PCC 7375]
MPVDQHYITIWVTSMGTNRRIAVSITSFSISLYLAVGLFSSLFRTYTFEGIQIWRDRGIS